MQWYRIKVLTDKNGTPIPGGIWFERRGSTPNTVTMYTTISAARRAKAALQLRHPGRQFEITAYRVSEMRTGPGKRAARQTYTSKEIDQLIE